MTFESMGLAPEIVEALAKLEITMPLPIQGAAYAKVCEGRDVYLNAETGTGKTLGYLLPLFRRIDVALDGVQVVVVVPTHELALQVQRQCQAVVQHAELPVRTLVLAGGSPRSRQIEKLKGRPHLVVGTPGRLLELIDMRRLKVHQVVAVVLDEADRLLAPESEGEIRELLHTMPRRCQKVMVSASYPSRGVERVVLELAPELEMVSTASAPVNERITHWGLLCEERDKPDIIRSLYHALEPERMLVFAHRVEDVALVAEKLGWHKIPVVRLDAASSKRERQQAREAFTSGAARVMLASDVAARGLDIPGVSHVVNMDLPSRSKAYLHRVGRTARGNASGTAISLVTQQERQLVRKFEYELKLTVQPVSLRYGKVVESSLR